jgi:hypothetical protein
MSEKSFQHTLKEGYVNTMKNIFLAILALALLTTQSVAQRGRSHSGGAMHASAHADLAQANSKKQDKDRDPSPDNDKNKGKHKGETQGKHKAKGHRH